jgi:hypothetical protein
MSGRLFGWDLLEQEAIDHARSEVLRLREMAVGDSPIERLFLVALSVVASWQHRTHTAVALVRRGSTEEKRDRLIETSEMLGELSSTLFVDTQVDFSWGRADFLVSVATERGSSGRLEFRRLVIECDGHNFHERTKLQAERDRSRDRAAQLEGLEVFRFTGSELWRNPVECADQVLAWAEKF